MGTSADVPTIVSSARKADNARMNNSGSSNLTANPNRLRRSPGI